MSYASDQLRKDREAMLKKGVQESLPYSCPLCGGDVFIEAIKIRRVSALYSSNGQPFFFADRNKTAACIKCGKEITNDEPKDLQENNQPLS